MDNESSDEGDAPPVWLSNYDAWVEDECTPTTVLTSSTDIIEEFPLSRHSKCILDAEINRALAVSTRVSLKFPWELTQPFPDTFAAGVHKLTLKKLAGVEPVPEVPAQITLRRQVGSLLSSAVKRLHVIPWPVQRGAFREKAVRRWRLIIEENLRESTIGLQLYESALNAYDDAKIQMIVTDVFAVKSSNTLNKRSGPILKFLVWHRTVYGTSGIPFSESRLYDYAKDKSTSATFAKSLLSALRFCRHFLGFSSATEATESKRLIGAAHHQAMDKRVLKQRRPLTLQEILGLEHLAVQAVCPYDRYAANFFLGQLYSRARFNDYCLSHNLIVDFEGETAGYIEAPTLFSKTQKSTEAKRTAMPQVAPRLGVSHSPWADKFVAERKAQGLEKFACLLPTPSTDGTWHDVPTEVGTASKWLKALLITVGFDPTDVGTHSLKRTLLSWCAKFGIDINVRALLGYHVSTEHSSVMVYSRDAMAAPLRSLEQMLLAVRERVFHPDKTRSGYMVSKRTYAISEPTAKSKPSKSTSSDDTWHVAAVTEDPYQIAEATTTAKDAEAPAAETVASGDDLDSSESSSSDSSEGDGLTDVVAHKALCKIRPMLPADTEGKIPYYHPTSAVLHFRFEGVDRLNCGRTLSKLLIKTKWQKSPGLINCAQCARVVTDISNLQTERT